MTTTPKRPRTTGRLGQLNKRTRLTRRALGQWIATTDAQLPNRLKGLLP